MIWALGEAMSGTDVNYILDKAAAAGYNLSGLNSSLRSLSEKNIQ